MQSRECFLRDAVTKSSGDAHLGDFVEPQLQSTKCIRKVDRVDSRALGKVFPRFILRDLRGEADYLDARQVLRLVLWHRLGVRSVARRGMVRNHAVVR